VTASSGELEFERVAFFSDAVFAIAVTLLIINLHVPASMGTGPAAARFARGLGQELGRIVSWALSFYVVARAWIGHHTLFRYLRRVDSRLIALNLAFLALVAFLPYATAVLGDWGDTGPGTAFYAVSMAAVGLTQSALLVPGPPGRADLADPVHVVCCVPRETLWRRLAVARRNLTVQLDEETIREAKVLAAKRGTSISGLVARELERLVAGDARYEEARRRAVELMAQAVEHGGRSWRREDLHQDEGPWSALR
jgi:hypothetical protein